MKLYIFPKYMEEAAKPGWIVRWLQAVGIIQVLGCIILGATVGGPLIANALTQAGVMSQEAASASALLIGLAAGILVGLWLSMRSEEHTSELQSP